MASFVLNHPTDIIVVSTDDDHPNILYIDRDAETIMVQATPDQFQIRKGRLLIGTVSFVTEGYESGWRFEPRGSQFQPGGKLHRFPEGAVRRRLRIARVYVNGCYTESA